MTPQADKTYSAFYEEKRIAQGDILEVARKVHRHLDKNPRASVFIFDNMTSAQIEVDFRGNEETMLQRLKAQLDPKTETATGPGRPKLGVVSREISLLPQHWEWLASQSGGASATLRKLVDSAQKQNRKKDETRKTQEAVYKFMQALAGDLPLYEEALRALYANNGVLFRTLVAPWPKDIRKHTLDLAESLFDPE